MRSSPHAPLSLGSARRQPNYSAAGPRALTDGGGQYQNGYVGFEGMPIEMVQYNTEAVVPFFASTRGYGILWDNNAWSHLNPPEGAPLSFSKSPSGALVASFTPTVSGDHAVFADLCAGFGCGSIKGGVLSLRVVDSSSGAVRRVQEWDGRQPLLSRRGRA